VEKAILTELLLMLVATMFGLLVAVFGWLSNKLYDKIEYMNKGLREMEHAFRERIHHVDTRITKVETEQAPTARIVSIKK
jgi:hypothetical protein